MTNYAQCAKAGGAGGCSVYLIVFGIFLVFPGAVMLSMANDPDFQDPFFEDSNK